MKYTVEFKEAFSVQSPRCDRERSELVSINLTEIVKAPPDNVFSLLSDFEKAPQYSNYWKSVKLIRRDGNSATCETVAQAEGRKISSVTRITTQPSQRLDAETIDGDGKGTKMSFILVGVPEGTQITLQGEIVLPGFAKLLGGVVKGRIESGMKGELTIIKTALEH